MTTRSTLPQMTQEERSHALIMLQQEEAKRTRLVLIAAVCLTAIDMLALVLTFVVALNLATVTNAVRKTQLASQERLKDTQKQATQGAITSDQVRRTLVILDCAIAEGEKFPGVQTSPNQAFRDKAQKWFEDCLVLNNVQGSKAIKLPPDPT